MNRFPWRRERTAHDTATYAAVIPMMRTSGSSSQAAAIITAIATQAQTGPSKPCLCLVIIQHRKQENITVLTAWIAAQGEPPSESERQDPILAKVGDECGLIDPDRACPALVGI